MLRRSASLHDPAHSQLCVHRLQTAASPLPDRHVYSQALNRHNGYNQKDICNLVSGSVQKHTEHNYIDMTAKQFHLLRLSEA